MQITIHESDTRLSQLVERAVAGEEIIIGSETGEPLAKIVSLKNRPDKPVRRQLGVWRGKVKIADDFDEIPEEIAEAFGIKDNE